MIYVSIYLAAYMIIFLAIQLLFERTKYRELALLINTSCSVLVVFLIFYKVESITKSVQKPIVASNRYQQQTQDSIKLQKETKIPIIDVPIINQYPELPRGCEVTALAMLLQYEGVNVNKLQLATEIKKNSANYKVIKGQVYFGHPNKGYVGNMYNLAQPGYGVYHSPIMELSQKYLPNQMVDITGKDFSEVEKYIKNQKPVWVITNVMYKKLSNDYFEKWITPDGEIYITYKEHSVIVTGFDHRFVYFNDPITGVKNKKLLKKDFIEAWVQMGSQAVTVKY